MTLFLGNPLPFVHPQVSTSSWVNFTLYTKTGIIYIEDFVDTTSDGTVKFEMQLP